VFRIGDRGLWIGSTGTGKTVAMALALDRLYGQRQMVILNSKDDPAFSRWRGLRVKHLAELRKAQWPRDSLLIWTPDRAEVRNPAYADAFCSWLWARKHTIVGIDELRMLAPSAIPLPGFADLVERSRGPRDLTVAMGTQRPSFIPHSAYTEASVVYLFRLASKQDRGAVAAFTHESLAEPVRHRHGFWEYRAGDMHATYWPDVRDMLDAEEAPIGSAAAAVTVLALSTGG
jgi:hypothetical protein